MVTTTTIVPPAAELHPAVFDPARLAAVAISGLLDSEAESAFDDLARLAVAVTGAQRAFFTIADEHRSFWKSAIGMDPAAGRENDIRDSPCHILIGTGQPLIAEDAATDPRVKDLAAVGALGIGAWAGYPVFSPDGHVLGGFCVVDREARPFTEEQAQALLILSRSVSSEIALRQALREARSAGDASSALARALQQSLLPPRLPTVPGIDSAAVYLPAEATGAEVVGDFYDLFRTGGDAWSALMGDVCGKGIDAAKVTALARYTVRAEATQHDQPATVLHRLHEAILDQQVSDRFLTAALVSFRLDGSGVAGLYASAGHPPAYIRRANGTVEALDAPGILLSPLMRLDRRHLAQTAFHLHPGDALLLYTDGITEARGRDGGARYGDDRLIEALGSTSGATAAETLRHLRKAVSAHAGGYAIDDTALMLLRVEPRLAYPAAGPSEAT